MTPSLIFAFISSHYLHGSLIFPYILFSPPCQRVIFTLLYLLLAITSLLLSLLYSSRASNGVRQHYPVPSTAFQLLLLAQLALARTIYSLERQVLRLAWTADRERGREDGMDGRRDGGFDYHLQVLLRLAHKSASAVDLLTLCRPYQVPLPNMTKVFTNLILCRSLSTSCQLM